MKSPARATCEREAMLPLLSSIQLEIVDRSHHIVVLEERLEAFADTPRIHAEEIGRLQSELSTQRRELRHVAKELDRLGIEFDPEAPRPIDLPTGRARERSGSLDGTGFRFWTSASVS